MWGVGECTVCRAALLPLSGKMSLVTLWAVFAQSMSKSLWTDRLPYSWSLRTKADGHPGPGLRGPHCVLGRPVLLTTPGFLINNFSY